MSKKNLNKNIRTVFWLYFVLYVMLQIYLVKFITLDSKDIAINPHNPRLDILNQSIKRGDIISSDGEILATSEPLDGGYLRDYKFSREYVHLIGNINYQKSGIEANYNFKLQKLFFDMSQRLNNIAFDTELKGNSAILTVDSGLQNFVYNTLGDKKGAIIVSEPTTGKILAMASYPNYDPNTITANWESLNTDEENAPLLNRATKGMYPPGSVFKTVTALYMIRNIPDYNNIYHECTGEITIGDTKIRCFDSTAHGNVNLEEAIRVSCNTYFASVSDKIDKQNYANMAESLLFNRNYKYPLEKSQSSFKLSENSPKDELMHTLIGQGKTLMTPLHISLLTSGIANDGVIMEPYVVDYFETVIGTKTEKSRPKKLTEIMTKDESETLSYFMWRVVEEGTGKDAKISGIDIAGKTGTAENSTGQDHSLFTCFAPVDSPKVVVTVVFENSAEGRAVTAAGDILQYFFDNF